MDSLAPFLREGIFTTSAAGRWTPSQLAEWRRRTEQFSKTTDELCGGEVPVEAAKYQNFIWSEEVEKVCAEELEKKKAQLRRILSNNAEFLRRKSSSSQSTLPTQHGDKEKSSESALTICEDGTVLCSSMVDESVTSAACATFVEKNMRKECTPNDAEYSRNLSEQEDHEPWISIGHFEYPIRYARSGQEHPFDTPSPPFSYKFPCSPRTSSAI